MPFHPRVIQRVHIGRPARRSLGALGREPLLGLGCVGRHAAVRRIEDQLRAVQPFTDVVPERVISAGVASRRRRIVSVPVSLLDVLGLFVRERLPPRQWPGQWPLERRGRLAVPLPLQVGIAPRRAWRHVRLAARLRQDRPSEREKRRERADRDE
jgi:hypothetical protein